MKGPNLRTPSALAMGVCQIGAIKCAGRRLNATTIESVRERAQSELAVLKKILIECSKLIVDLVDQGYTQIECATDPQAIKTKLSFVKVEVVNFLIDEVPKGTIGAIDKALEVAYTISDSKNKSCALARIAHLFTHERHLEKALNIAGTIPDLEFKSQALRHICAKLAQSGHFDLALEIANTVPVPLIRSIALRHICAELAEKGMSDWAQKIASGIPDEEQRHGAVWDVSRLPTRSRL